MKRAEKESREKLIKAVSLEIEKSIPLEPIMFTKDGDLLVEYPLQPYTSGGFPYFVEEHVKDKNVLGSCVGLHDSCGGGWILKNLLVFAMRLCVANVERKPYFQTK